MYLGEPDEVTVLHCIFERDVLVSGGGWPAGRERSGLHLCIKADGSEEGASAIRWGGYLIGDVVLYLRLVGLRSTVVVIVWCLCYSLSLEARSACCGVYYGP